MARKSTGRGAARARPRRTARTASAAKDRAVRTAARRASAREARAPPAAPPPSPELPARRDEGAPFPIVGIGSSAGGLEALEQFLRKVPARSGMAYVIVQHLDPADGGAFVELLRRVSPIPVAQVEDAMEVAPDHVYVIPPGKDLSVLHGALHVLPPAQPRGLNLPVDFFLRSLAEDRQDRAAAVILSGMGTDGTLGLRAIKEKGGAALVQALDSARFDSMPRSALDTGLVDVAAPAADLPERLALAMSHARLAPGDEAGLEDPRSSMLSKVFILLRHRTGNDFSLYKRSTIYRRIDRRMGLHQIDELPGYIRLLRENPKEVDLLFRELLIGVTSFFRDPAAWDHLKKKVVPALLAAHPHGGTIRAWVPGCSTGEEAYSLAMVLREALEERPAGAGVSVQIFATDLDTEAVDKARAGVYPANVAADVSPERLRRFFVPDERGFRVSKEIRESVVFAPQNVIMDPPFTKLDLLSCRNLLIYLSPEVQKKLIPMFHYALNPGGALFLGSAETVGAFGALFAPIDGKARLFRRLDQAATPAPVELFSSYRSPTAPQEPQEPSENSARAPRESFQTLAERFIVQRLAPSAVLTTDRGDILYVSGRTGRYLEPAAGRASMNVFSMAREGLRHDLGAAFSAALREERPVTVRGVRAGTDGGGAVLDLTVQRLLSPAGLRGTVLVVLAEAPVPPTAEARAERRPASSARSRALAAELAQAQEELQSTREEMQTSQEELRSMNEELQSTNEELQSSNEELTTSKEEMQSMNEELQTVNLELQSKVDELSRSNNDMKNLLNSTDIATLFLDGDLHIRRFTTQTSKLIKLIPGDAGRPITDIASELDYPDLAEDAREVLRTLLYKERQVGTKDGRWFAVRILPYRTLDNVIDGVVITFSEVTATKSLERKLRVQAGELRLMADLLPAMIWGSAADGTCDYLSGRWFEYTGDTSAESSGRGWLEQVHPEERERVEAAWQGAVRSSRPLETELRLRDRSGGYRWFLTRAVPVLNDLGNAVRWYGTHTDVEELRRRWTGAAPPEGSLADDAGRDERH